MKNSLKYIILLLSVFYLLSCEKIEKEDISLYKVLKTDFVDVIRTEGLSVPEDVITINMPNIDDCIITYLVEEGIFVKEGDTLCVLENKGLLKEYNEAVGELKIMQATYEKEKIEQAGKLSLLRSELESNQLNDEMQKMDTAYLAFASPKERRIKELELERNSIQRKLLEDKVKHLSEIQKTELKQLEILVSQEEFAIERLKDKLKELVILSPSNSIVLYKINPWTQRKVFLGESPWAGVPILEMLKANKMKITLKLYESDYKRININDSVTYTFDALPGLNASGKIITKSPVGKSFNPEKEDSKIKIFELEGSIEKTDSMPKANFMTNCNIIVNNVADTIVIPNIAIFQEDSIQIVFVKKRKGFERRQVQVGKTSSKESVIEKGLKENEIIALSKPNEKSIKSIKSFPKIL